MTYCSMFSAALVSLLQNLSKETVEVLEKDFFSVMIGLLHFWKMTQMHKMIMIKNGGNEK